ncbi:MAG: hypothetical protein GX829_03155 [Clostridium sp.]|nr:hypothetical protein [Clostridium sp.]
MHREIIDGLKLKEILPNLPEELLKGKVEVVVKPYGNENLKVTKLLDKINRRVERSAYLGKEKEVFFIEEEEIEQDLRRSLLQALKEQGYEAELKEGARDTLVLKLNWSNEKMFP